MKNTISGVNLKSSMNDKISIFENGTNNIHTITKSVVYGKLIFLLNRFVKQETKSKIRNDKPEVILGSKYSINMWLKFKV